MAKYFQLLKNMGLRYVWFRLTYEIHRRTGLLKLKFPTQPPMATFIGLKAWKALSVKFFFESRAALLSEKQPFGEISTSLKTQIAEYRRGSFLFFSAQYYPVADWVTNPASGFRYDTTKHWTEISDFSTTAGDIKYVWEKSRFAFIYPLIRYDFKSGEDFSETIFTEIESWIESNPINCGPNWRCSQEISLRVLNWTFALHYYKNTNALTESRFQKISHDIYWQMRHVEANIDFSRIAVRNNHAITETLTLYLVGLLYPHYPESKRWKSKGKRWFEEEVAYQVYEDGTFLQFSMNYHRVVVQLLTWAIRLAELNNERFTEVVYKRAHQSLIFLRACQDETTGWLPNYGNNDGALFFPLNDAHFRDYRPQLSALAAVLGEEGSGLEDEFWYGGGSQQPVIRRDQGAESKEQGARDKVLGTHDSALDTHVFSQGGYFTLKEADTLTFIRCGAYKDRPFQADNLHLDIWVNGENIMRDAGSYLYNTDEKWVKYFAGTASHNTVMLGEYDQMCKGPRFVWYDWVKEANGRWQLVIGDQQWAVGSRQSAVGNTTFNVQRQKSNVKSQLSSVHFEGTIKAFGHLGENIYHRRCVTKAAGEQSWMIEDWLENVPEGFPMHQIWHPSDAFFDNFSIQAFDQEGQELTVAVTEGWYSSMYGCKEPTRRLVFSSLGRYIKTYITRI